MEKTAVPTSVPEKHTSAQMKALLASYLEGQPENIRSFHRWMKVLEAISFGIVIIVFITALVLSIMWKSVRVKAVSTACSPPSGSFDP